MNINRAYLIYLLFLNLIALVLGSCSNEKPEPLFEMLSSETTGITFSNNLEETPQLNIFSYLYFYNGGGVAVGDLNGDGLADLYFTSNMEDNKLYLNKGEFKFFDITEQSNVQGKKGWTTGVTIADVNGDGKLDLYVSQLGDYKNIRGRNQLYINKGNNENGIPVFEDEAKTYGLDLVGFSTQAAFFDYDLDGDLDMFMMNHSVHSNGTYGKSSLRSETHPLAGDKLLKNEEGKFIDVTEEAGIYSSVLGYGLGITISDINWDGYPDIYVGNDFHENDYLYYNNGDGTFTEKLESAINHTSKYSMGNDIADINNDGLVDIISLDMLPEDPAKLRTSAGEDPYDVYSFKLSYGYNHQYARNTLQLNLGNENFSDIAYFSGIEATDWSWSSLLADFDLDGFKDVFIANGIKRRMNDLDYINYISNEAIQHRLEGDLTDEDLKLVEKMPVVKIPNYGYKNNGDLTFTNMSEIWGLNQESFSNGAAYADLDNDGDLDLISNNVDQEAFIYRNNAISPKNQKNNFIKIRPKGKDLNTQGVGLKVVIPFQDQKIVQEHFPTRGYLSAMSDDLIIGLGNRERIDSLILIWPDHSFQVLKNLKANQIIDVDRSNASGVWNFENKKVPYFEDVTEQVALSYKHEENKFIEFNREQLIPHMASTEGPKIAVGDVNGDGKEDFFVGGAKHQPGFLFIQSSSGFNKSEQGSLKTDSLHEDTGAIFLDVDNDSDLDLIVVSAGNEFQSKDKALKPRLYKNDGSGNFFKDEKAVPEIFLNASCIKSVDLNQDGFHDLFIGGRVLPWNYGKAPSSYILINDGKGNFIDQTDSVAPDLHQIGMVKDAHWFDFDQDGLQDLILAGEWMPITIFLNKDGVLKKTQIKGLENSDGWWNTLAIADVNKDGKPDIVAGNLGQNSLLKASKTEPLSMFVKDFNEDGKTDQLVYFYRNGKENLFPIKDELGKQMVEIKTRYVKYADFAQSSHTDIFPKEQLKGADKLLVNELRSGTFINKGNLEFEFVPFPVQAQLSPIQAFHVFDYNRDGFIDIFSAGNFHEVNVRRGRYDADHGTLLKNDGKGSFKTVDHLTSGLKLKGQVRDIKKIIFNGEEAWLLAKNNEPIQMLVRNKTDDLQALNK